jgi:archaellum component FlaC
MNKSILLLIAFAAVCTTASARLGRSTAPTVAVPASSARRSLKSIPKGASKAEALTIKHDNLLLTLRDKHARLTRAEIRDLAEAKIAARVEEERATHARFTQRVRKGIKATRTRRENQTFAEHRQESLQAFRSKLQANANAKAPAGRKLLSARRSDRRLWGQAKKAYKDTAKDAKKFFQSNFNKIKNGFGQVTDTLENLAQTITSIDDHLERLVDSVFEEVFEVLADIMNGLASTASASINGAVAGCIEPLAGCVPDDGTELASYEAFGQTIFEATLNNAEFKLCLNEVDLDLNMDADKLEAFYDAIMNNVGDFAMAVVCPVNDGMMDVVDEIENVMDDVVDAVKDVAGWVGIDSRRQRRLTLVQADNVGGNFCTEAAPCALGYGDCDDDAQCAGALKCYQRAAGNAMPPGISLTADQQATAADFCYDASLPIQAVNEQGLCTADTPCYAGYGDCDNNSECRGDLKCFQRDADGATPPGLTLSEAQKASAADFCYSPDSSCPAPSLDILGRGIEGALKDLMADALVSVETYQMVDLELEVSAQAAYLAEGDVLSKVPAYKPVKVDVKIPVFTGVMFGFSLDLDIEVPWKVVIEGAAHGSVSFHQGSTTTVAVAVAGGGVTRTQVQDEENGLTFPAAIDTLQFSMSMGFGIKEFDLLFEVATFGASVYLESSFSWKVMEVGLDVAHGGTATSAASGYDLVGFPSTGGLCTQATLWVGEPSFEFGIGYDTAISQVAGCATDSLLRLGSGALTLAQLEGDGMLAATPIFTLGCI